MSVEIDSPELGFHRPFTTEVSQTLRIRNPNHTPVAFKVKTTAPKQYCVRPNSGRLEPGRSIDVTVLLQAMKVEPPLDAKCRDKFLVQSVEITPDKEFLDQSASHVDRADKSQIQEKKIRVVFLPPEASNSSSTPMRNGISGASSVHSTPDAAPPAYRSPSPEEQHYTPGNRVVSGGPSPAPAVQINDEPAGNRNLADARSSAFNPATSTSSSVRDTAASTVAAVSNAVPTSVEELKAELAQARKTIASYAEQGGLRMRKVVNGETSNETVNELATKMQGTEGVPVQIVAALCLLSFLLAYLFF